MSPTAEPRHPGVPPRLVWRGFCALSLAWALLLVPIGEPVSAQSRTTPDQRDPEFSVDSLVNVALVAPDTPSREAALQAADALVDQWLANAPDDANALYWKAACAGLLAETASTRDKITLGKSSLDYAEEALASDSSHAGAHHVVGRIHAGVKRLSWFTRLIGRRLGMGPLLEVASWEAADLHLGRATHLEPDNVTFGLEYAVALDAMGRPYDAAGEFARIVAIDPLTELDRAAQARACEFLVEEFGAASCP